jgi:hypothetical protein
MADRTARLNQVCRHDRERMQRAQCKRHHHPCQHTPALSAPDNQAILCAVPLQ